MMLSGVGLIPGVGRLARLEREAEQQVKATLLARLIMEASDLYGATPSEILGPSRLAHIVRARTSVWRKLKFEHEWSYPAIARAFNRKNHTTVLKVLRYQPKRGT